MVEAGLAAVDVGLDLGPADGRHVAVDKGREVVEESPARGVRNG
jgi:hypothetical protein